MTTGVVLVGTRGRGVGRGHLTKERAANGIWSHGIGIKAAGVGEGKRQSNGLEIGVLGKQDTQHTATCKASADVPGEKRRTAIKEGLKGSHDLQE